MAEKIKTLPKVDISVIIVSYNGADALMLTLASVRRAVEWGRLTAEVIVVDNNSCDATPDRVREQAPWVKFIEMGYNAGFSKANNAGLREAKGDVLMLLNPDTVVCRDTLSKIVAHFRQNPQSGAVGVRMVDGKGRFLGESKRGYTTIMTSLFKFSGLWHMAPKSRILNAYYIGNVPETGVCHAQILSGACMVFSRDLYERVGGLDESYFMYCEDNDYSWRMEMASGGNVFRGDIPIIHFKGQSTPRQRKYVERFYESMLIFARKYEFPKHTKIVNMMTAVGIKAISWMAMLKIAVLNVVDRRSDFSYPRRVVLVSDRALGSIVEGIERHGAKVDVVKYGELRDDVGGEAVVFDIGGDVELAIEFMRRNEGKRIFGFANDDAGDSLVYCGNRLHNLSPPVG